MLPPEVLEAAKILEDPRAPEKERDKAAHVYHGFIARQAPTTEILEHLSPQVDKDRLPLQVGRRYFHSWKDTEALYREVTEWKHFSLDQCPSVSAPPDTQAAFEDIFADLIKERGAVLKLHPLYRRWTVFLKEPTADQGFQYLASIMIVESDGKCGQISADLERDLDPRLHPVIRSLGVGGYKVPTRKDFEHLRWNWADRSRETARQKARRMMTEQIKLEDAETAQKMDFIDDFVSHNAALLSRDINRKYGSMQGLPFLPSTSLEEFERENPEFEVVEALDPATGQSLGFSHRRRLKPYERGDLLTSHEKRMIAIIAYRDYWKAAVVKVELDLAADDPQTQAQARLDQVKLRFLDPALTQAEVEAMVQAANETCPGMVDALFNMKGPWATFQSSVDTLQLRVAEAIKLQSIAESNAWRVSLGLPTRPLPEAGFSSPAIELTPRQRAQLEFEQERELQKTEAAAEGKEGAWQSRVLQQQRSQS